MGELFLKILNMSFVASWLILAVILLRLALKKAPKWITCALWALAAIRLVCPFSLESKLSVVQNQEPFTQEIVEAIVPGVSFEAPSDRDQNNGEEPTKNPEDVHVHAAHALNGTGVAAGIWGLGVVVLLSAAKVSYGRLRRRVRPSLHLRDNIWLCDEITAPFLLGVFRPKIYIPSGIDESSLPPIIAHENAHLKRRDHWWKPLGFLILSIHWFNPLVWLAYILLCRDIELACDEKVIRDLGKEESIAYSEALLSCSISRRTILVCPLAFGEVGVKERVKCVLNYKKPAFWIMVVAASASLVLAVCFLTDPKGPREFPMSGRNLSDLDTDQILSGICKAEGLDDGSSLNLNAGSFDLMVTSGFDLNNAGAIPFSYVQNQKTYSAQLRLFYEENKYFVTDRSEWPEQTQICKLRDHLDALRFLPQEEIRKLSPDADHYSIYMRSKGTPEDYSRVVTYDKDGPCAIGGWQIHLEIQPLQNGHGIGADAIHAFYTSSGLDTLADSSPFGRSYHVQEIAYSDPVYNFAYTLETAPLYELTDEKGLLSCENKSDRIWLNTGTFREITLGEPNFAACFRDLDNMGWNGMDAGTLVKGNQQAWQLAVADQAENTVIYDLLLQKNGDLYLTYGYGDAANSDGTELSSIRWVFKLAEGLEAAPMSDEPLEVIDASLDEAIQKALTDHYTPGKPDGLIHVESCKILFQQALRGAPKAGAEQDAEKVTVYLLVLHESFRPDSDFTQPIEEVEGDYTPTALTFRLSDGKYLLEEYWEPRDGSYYTDDIKAKFPKGTVQQVWDDQETIKALQQANQEQIHRILQKQGSFEELAGRLLDTICKSGNLSSDPGACIQKAQEQYDELLGYGETTLQYCFRQFLEGGQTGLEGHIMAQLCRDIMEKQFGMAQVDTLYETGQAWFDAFYASSLEAAENVSLEDLEKHHPASKLLLDMTGREA